MNEDQKRKTFKYKIAKVKFVQFVSILTFSFTVIYLDLINLSAVGEDEMIVGRSNSGSLHPG